MSTVHSWSFKSRNFGDIAINHTHYLQFFFSIPDNDLIQRLAPATPSDVTWQYEQTAGAARRHDNNTTRYNHTRHGVSSDKHVIQWWMPTTDISSPIPRLSAASGRPTIVMFVSNDKENTILRSTVNNTRTTNKQLRDDLNFDAGSQSQISIMAPAPGEAFEKRQRLRHNETIPVLLFVRLTVNSCDHWYHLLITCSAPTQLMAS